MADYGLQTQADISDIIPVFIAPAMYYYDVTGIMKPLVTEYTLPAGSGPDYAIPRFLRMEAMDLEENVPIAQGQTVNTETALTVTPAEVGMQVLVGRRSARMAKEDVLRAVGRLTGIAMALKEDEDILSLFGGVTNVKGAAGATAVPGYFGAARAFIRGNATNKNTNPVFGVVHDYQFHTVQQDLSGMILGSLRGVGLEDGKSSDIALSGEFEQVQGVKVIRDGNITIDANDDATGCVFTKDAFVYVKSTGLEEASEFDLDMRATKITIVADYGFGLYDQNFACRIVSDATEPEN